MDRDLPRCHECSEERIGAFHNIKRPRDASRATSDILRSNSARLRFTNFALAALVSSSVELRSLSVLLEACRSNENLKASSSNLVGVSSGVIVPSSPGSVTSLKPFLGFSGGAGSALMKVYPPSSSASVPLSLGVKLACLFGVLPVDPSLSESPPSCVRVGVGKESSLSSCWELGSIIKRSLGFLRWYGWGDREGTRSRFLPCLCESESELKEAVSSFSSSWFALSMLCDYVGSRTSSQWRSRHATGSRGLGLRDGWEKMILVPFCRCWEALVFPVFLWWASSSAGVLLRPKRNP